MEVTNRICPYCGNGNVWQLEENERGNGNNLYCRSCYMRFSDNDTTAIEIDKERIIDSLETDAQNCGDYIMIPIDTYYETIAELKEQPEIIRCKDCKYGRQYEKELVDCEFRELATEHEWFCADGKRRTDDV